jgi:hypothetical protein
MTPTADPLAHAARLDAEAVAFDREGRRLAAHIRRVAASAIRRALTPDAAPTTGDRR